MANKALHELVDTWNNGGTTFNAIRMDVTDSASAAASRLLRLDVGSAERFGVRKDGAIMAGTWGIACLPLTDDGVALGSTTKQWSDLFLASGAVINFNNGDVTVTHSANGLVFAGASSGYTFDDDIIAVGDILTSAGNRKAAVATTSGSLAEFTSIPANCHQITLTLEGVSVSGTDSLYIQLGDSGGYETTGYAGAVSVLTASGVVTTSETAAFLWGAANAANLYPGSFTLTLVDSATNTWVCQGSVATSNAAINIVTSGSKSLSATLDRIKLDTSGTNTFDAGKVGLIYR